MAMQAPITPCGIENVTALAHFQPMLRKSDLLAKLKERKVPKAEMARALGVAPPRINEIYNNERKLEYDEGVKLLEAFKLDDSADDPISVPIARLAVLHLADELGIQLDSEDARVQELAQDLHIFSRYAADPRVRESVEAVEAFFQGLRLGRDRTA